MGWPSSVTCRTSPAGRYRTVHLGRLRPGVLERVRQGLLHDPVGGQVQPGGQGRRGAVDAGGRGQASSPDPVQQRRPGQTGPAATAPAVLLAGLRADSLQHPAQLGQRLPARRADRAQRLPGRLRAGAEHVLGGTRLDDDHAEGVGDDVVQLAPDPGLLLGDRPPGLQFLLAAAVGGPVPAVHRGRRPTAHPAVRKLRMSTMPRVLPLLSSQSGQARTVPAAMPAHAASRRGQYAATE